MTRSEMRDEVWHGANHEALVARDIPLMVVVIALAKVFRETVAEAHLMSNGDAIDTFLSAFDDALGDLQGKLEKVSNP